MDRRGGSSTIANGGNPLSRSVEDVGVRSFLPLPVDRPRSAARYRGASETLVLPSDLVDALGLAGSAALVGRAPTVLAAFAVLLHRYCGEDDVVVGVPAPAFDAGTAAGTTGSPADTWPMRIDTEGDPEFATLVERVREASRECGDGQRAASAGGAQTGPAVATRNASVCCQVRFDFIAASATDGTSRGRSDDVIPQLPVSVEEELALRIEANDAIVTSTIAYNAELFDVATIQRMLGHLHALLRRVAEDPRERISVLPLLTNAERRQLLWEWNAASRGSARLAAEMGARSLRGAGRADTGGRGDCLGQRTFAVP